MSKIQKRIDKDFKGIQLKADALFQVAMKDIGGVIEGFSKDTLEFLTQILFHHEKLDLNKLMMSGAIHRIDMVIARRAEDAAVECERIWGRAQRNFELLPHFTIAFINTKAQPKFKTVRIDLSNKPKDGLIDPRMGHLRFYFNEMSKVVCRQVSQGAVRQESPQKVIARVKALFDRKKPRNIKQREESYYGQTQDNIKQADFDLDITQGYFTENDVENFTQDLRRANDWAYREYNPWMTDAIKRNNRWLRDVEQTLSFDAVNRLHSGLLQIGTKDHGVTDMEWVTHGQHICDECRRRDGVPMKEIKKFRDKYASQVPPLHPNCKCELVPKLRDDWAADKASKDSALDYGNTRHGDMNLTFDEFINSIGK